MHQIDRALNRVDLNLLLVFEALWLDRHVGRAGRRLGLSQSATSHALNRLREAFGDALFVRHPKGVEPTPRASALHHDIDDALKRLRRVFKPATPFDPATLEAKITLGATDYAAFVVVAPLLHRLNQAAPGLDLRIVPVDQDSLVTALDESRIDCAIGNFPNAPKRIARWDLFDERFVGIARERHPILKRRKVNLRDFTSTPHALVSLRGDAHGKVDEALAAIGQARRVALTIGHFLALPHLVGSSDLIGVIAERAAVQLQDAARIRQFALPLSLAPWTVHLAALSQRREEPSLNWFLEQVRRREHWER